jgi:indole-3-glycerol phosphate synthase
MILDDILVQTRLAVERARQALPLTELEALARAADPPRDFWGALRHPATRAGADRTMACIAEFKRRSPSAGFIREGADPADIVRRYQAAGASALSVLTDEPFFAGRLEDLRQARQASTLPILRKDFMIDRYQVVEARAAGADAILLIVTALTDATLAELAAEAARWGLDVLWEAHDAGEVKRALAASARIVGINHRDLRTFKVDTTLAARMRPEIPPSRVVVAESGIRTAADVQSLLAAGIDAILVGETLMRAPDPGQALAALLGPAGAAV